MRSILFLNLLFVACCIGCGGKDFSVGGKVTFPDGTPLSRGQVTFMTASYTAGGNVAADGTYRINMRVPAGTYKVTVRASGDSPSDPRVSIADAVLPPPLVDLKFGNPETSGLVCEVKGATTFNITVEAPE